MIPPCAKWDLWIGGEVEGTADIGVKTLFVRSLPQECATSSPETLRDVLTQRGTIRRVWFCKEFTDWKLMMRVARLFPSVCVEATMETYHTLPGKAREDFSIYLKVPLRLKSSDHICVGPAFCDESFRVGTGAKVHPEAYLSDVKIL